MSSSHKGLLIMIFEMIKAMVIILTVTITITIVSWPWSWKLKSVCLLYFLTKSVLLNLLHCHNNTRPIIVSGYKFTGTISIKSPKRKKQYRENPTKH